MGLVLKKKNPTKKTTGLDGLSGEFYQTFWKEYLHKYTNFSRKYKRRQFLQLIL